MQTRQWHLFLVLVVGLPLKLHRSQGLFFPKTAILMLRERFLIAKNTCDRSALHTSANTQSASGHRLPQCATIVGHTTSFMPLPPLIYIYISVTLKFPSYFLIVWGRFLRSRPQTGNTGLRRVHTCRHRSVDLCWQCRTIRWSRS